MNPVKTTTHISNEDYLFKLDRTMVIKHRIATAREESKEDEITKSSTPGMDELNPEEQEELKCALMESLKSLKIDSASPQEQDSIMDMIVN